MRSARRVEEAPVAGDGIDLAERFSRALDSADPRRLHEVLDPSCRADRLVELIQVEESRRWHEAYARSSRRR